MNLNFTTCPALSRFAKTYLAALFLVFATASLLRADILNSQEAQIASNMKSSSEQGRASINIDPILAGVARARAADMARRNYFAHVNPDGFAANYLVRKAGYQLPNWWGNDPAANYVESIAAGYATASAAWTGWMNSPEHRTHILGLNSFYAAETSVGVGYCYDANSTYKYYWVIITAPPAPAAKLVITSPADKADLTTSEIALAGTTTADSGAVTVVYRIENANGVGVFQNADGVTNWSATASGFIPGENTIRVRSLDAGSVVIAEVARKVTYVQMGTLTVVTSGSGSVTTGFEGTTSREAGKTYTIAAVPAAGSLFSGWSGDASTPKCKLAFTMKDNVNLQANFIPNPFLAVTGVFTGLASSGEHLGLVKIALTKSGGFTGKVRIDGVMYAFIGSFDTDGAATITIPRGKNTPLTLVLQADLAGGTEQITGTISDGTYTADISTDRASFDALSNPAPQAGRYTVVLSAEANTSGADVPHGNGFATLVVKANGAACIVGRLADNTPIAQGSMVSKDGALPVFLALNGEKGAVAGTLSFNATDVSDLDGTVTWTKAAHAGDHFYANGFTTQLPVVGSRYTAPALDFSSGTVSLGDGNIDSPLALPVTISGKKVALTSPDATNFAAAINPGSGWVKGSLIHPDGSVKRGVNGVVLQKQKTVFGYFRGVDQTGYFSLDANAAN